MSSSALLDAALVYAADGRPVFPVRLDKSPLTPHGFKNATTDEATVRRWWTDAPQAGIATPTGPDWLVLDVDDERALTALVAEHGPLPPTRQVLTPRPGRHLYLLGSVTNSDDGLPDDIHVRGRGGYVLLPPSPHEQGGTYEWRDEDLDLAPAPAWLLQLLIEAPSPNGQAPPEGDIGTGKRNTILTSLAGSMRYRGFDAQEIAGALLPFNRRRCKPPLDESEVIKIVRSVGRYKPTIDLGASYGALTELLGLDEVNRRIEKVQVFGRGTARAVYIHLDNDEKIVLDPIGQFSTAPKLTLELGLVAGVKKVLKGPDVYQAWPLIHELAGYEQTFEDDDRAAELGREYLRSAPIAEVTMADQESRWKVFSHLDGHSPATLPDRTGLVLEDLSTGLRYVRCSWFGDWVNVRSGPGESRSIARSLIHLGWQKPGRDGLIKATAKGRNAKLTWAFFVVPKDWGDR